MQDNTQQELGSKTEYGHVDVYDYHLTNSYIWSTALVTSIKERI